MDAGDQAMLFQRFSQVNQAAGQRKVGTGLGLWICKELANRLDGNIMVRSTIGIGSVFEFTVRTKVSHPDEKLFNHPNSLENIDNVPIIHPLQQREAKTMKILIADDDNFNIELMKNYLNKFEISYLCAYDGEEAVSLFKKHHKEICYVITDNCMPKKTGAEAALEIASFLEEMREPKIPIMCISGDVKVNVGGKGITSVLQKPINFDQLKGELAAVFPHIYSEIKL
jgi:CheY-like chemotaxis protein